MRRVKQICISIPAVWVPDLDQRAAERGISRSSFISQLIYESVRELSDEQELRDEQEEVLNRGEA